MAMPIAPVGFEFLVNTATLNDQNRPTVTALDSGRFLYTWSDNSQASPDTLFTAVRARIFNADGSEAVAEFVVNADYINSQNTSAVTRLSDGRFVVTWNDTSQTDADQSGGAIRARIFNPDGTEAVAQFRVNTPFNGNQVDSHVAALAEGRFIVTWTDESGTGTDADQQAVRATIFNPDGTIFIAEFQVNTTTAASQRESSVTVLTNGNIVITWTDTSQTGGDTSIDAIRARIFNSSGVEVVPEFLVNTTTDFYQFESRVVALANGGFIVTYRDSAGTDDVRARIFDANGSQAVAEFIVNSTTAANQFQGSVTALADGRILVTWTDTSETGGDNSGYAIRGRILNADGTEAIPEFLINSTVNLDQTRSTATALSDGRFVVVWQDASASGDDTSGLAIRSQIFNPLLFTGTALADIVNGGDFNDTYTGGNGADVISGRGGADSLFGGADGDTLNGGDGADNLFGGTGADQHIGGNDAGIDYARYDDANYGNLTIRLDVPAANAGAAAIGDTYTGIEGLVGGLGADTVVGNGSANYLFGGGAADGIYGQGGADYLNGGEGGDNLWGGAGADSHIGGDDAGIDYARYDDANHGNLTIRLDTPASNVGAAAVGDTYNGIEGLVGGLGNDNVFGNASANYLFGGGGTDGLYGQGGADYLSGDAGGDNLWGGAGADQHIGGNDAGIDFARYDDANWGNLTIRLDAPSFNVGAVAVGDTYTGIEGLVGGLGNDIIIGNASNNYLFGSSGNDYIDGRAGNDYLNGGAGADRFVFNFALGASNVDTIADFVHLTDDIVLAQAVFAGIGATLDASEFQVGTADAATDRIIYNNVTGQLFYDSNGNAVGGMTQFATVTAGTMLSIADFMMV
jgi:Ca2+-binding RTX toxin-like protein